MKFITFPIKIVKNKLNTFLRAVVFDGVYGVALSSVNPAQAFLLPESICLIKKC